MTELSKQLWRACAALDLRIELGFTLSLGDGSDICTTARIPDLGAPNGMLVLASYATIREHLQQVSDAGYGFSVLSEPPVGEPFELETFVEMFKDWGWAGDPANPPSWM